MKTHLLILLSLLSLSLGFSSPLLAQPAYHPTDENLKSRQEFQDDKFGIFLHWGVYAMLATGEWTMNINNLNYKSMPNWQVVFILQNLMPINGLLLSRHLGLNIFV